jgi:SNF2 family DNA or RNA helicase
MDQNLRDWRVDREPPIAFTVQMLDLTRLASTQVISIPIPVRPIKTHSFEFTQPIGGEDYGKAKRQSSLRPRDPHNRGTNGARKFTRRTRLQPPRDIVKLSDRLFYLLQPPLESLLVNNAIELPFAPFDFQYEGVAFLFPRQSAILADEMGLGKTMQSIVAIRLLLRSGSARRVLLVCPKPLVTNWQRELALWAPEIPIEVISGKQARRQWHWQSDNAPLKIANYELLVRDKDLLVDLAQPFDLVVLDEAQRIKNRSSATNKIVREISRRRSWALTGTPIENGVDDLFGIFEFVAPGALHTGMTCRELKQEVRDFVLRRTKEMVIDDMPPKLIRDTELDLTLEQAEAYQLAENDGVIGLADLGPQITIKHVFELVLRLKQICNFDPLTGRSSKLEMLTSDLEEIVASGQKAIVFSQWVHTLKTIASRIPQFKPLEFHGRISAGQRDGVLNEFKESAERPVLLISYGAGSVGLNLQFCRYVYLFDRWWNPAVEDQAINRAHRIGTAASVTVTRMMMSGTIEQRIHEILEAKRALSEDILSESLRCGPSGLTQEEIFGLFNLRIPTGRIPQVA